MKYIKGSGGGGGGQASRKPIRDPDNLNSRQFATIQDLLSEGEIEGFASASKAGLTKGTTAYDNASLKDVFLDDTPILNSTADNSSPADTDFNFQDVTFTSKFGTANQTAMSGIPAESRSPTAVNVTVTTSAPVTRQVTNTDVDAVIITLTWPQIQIFEDDGDIHGDTIDYKIQVQYNGGGYNDIISTNVSGRTADAFSKDHRINISGSFPVDFRVVRATADSSDA